MIDQIMNEKTINEQYAYIYSLLEDRRLKEALIQLESLLWQCSDWDLRTRLEQLQTSYKYMMIRFIWRISLLKNLE